MNARNLMFACAMSFLLAAAGTGPASGAEPPKEENKTGVNLGKLTCKTKPGTQTKHFLQSSVSVDCTYQPNEGQPQKYGGEIGFLGVDVGQREERTLYFGVFGVRTGAALEAFPLQGNYYGTTLGAGVFGQGYGSSALVGGSQKGISVVPSVESFKGEGLIVGGTRMYLEPDRAAQAPGRPVREAGK
ncbi:MAG: DUF992 domain-containing protein [Candidatus Tectomicrobia bacterium]|uniref:DUF992 domain-containing protein n=1 Tax=Tectimicrobiota bacterium TaxID=2528274 RepID=A0A932I1G2_UNCTE|nr:DUF992 domain-containing protein [Candidatus Tectomicrobia bacterium]